MTNMENVHGPGGPPVGEAIAIMRYCGRQIQLIIEDESLQTREQIIERMQDTIANFIYDGSETFLKVDEKKLQWTKELMRFFRTNPAVRDYIHERSIAALRGVNLGDLLEKKIREKGDTQ